MTLDDTKDHLKEAAKSHNFTSEEEEKAWRSTIERLGGYLRENYNEEYEPKVDDESNDYIDDLIQEHHFKTLSDTEEIWRYDQRKGIYVPYAECMIKARIEKDHKDKVTNKFVNEQLGRIQRRTYINRNDFNPDIEWIATKNCMVNLRTGETEPFDPKFMNTTQIPVEYNPSPILDFFCSVEGVVNSDNIHCPAIMKFLHEIMSPSDVELVLDFLAYCLWRNYNFNVWMLFNGAGQNGKTTLLNLIEKFIGSKNYSAESLQRLLTERFAPANLYQKMLNVDADLSGDILSNNTGKLKKLTGNDEYPAEFKHKAPFKFKNYAKLIFSCNTIPEITDTTDAFFRRLIIINFTQQFLGDKEDIHLLDKLTTEKELSGLLHILVNRMPRVLENGIRKTTSEAMETTYDKYMRAANPIGYFVDNMLVNDSAAKTNKLDMYDAYQRFCLENGLALESDQSFSRKMTKSLGYDVKRLRVKSGERVYFYFGVRLKTPEEIENEKRVQLLGEYYSPETQEVMK